MPSQRSLSNPTVGQVWRVGQVVDGLYAVKELLGQGGFGSVHRVEHLGWRMEMAVKSPREDMISDASAKERFVREANTWVGLGLHPNIATCYFVRVIGGVPRIFLEYLEAGDLRDWLLRRKIADAKTALDAAIQLARAMERVQYRGLVHRDLKPENCLMTAEGVLKATDFGLAKEGSPEKTPEAEPPPGARSVSAKSSGSSGLYRLGTMEYMAPEQWHQAGKATSSADIWAFGVMLFELLHGERPFQRQENEPPISFYCRMKENQWRYKFREDAPADLKGIAASCLAEDAARREPEFGKLRQRLEALYTGMFGQRYPRPPVTQTPLLADALSNQGVSMVDLGRGEEALRLFGAALKQDPTHPGATYNQGVLLMKKGKMRPEELASRLDGCKRARPWEWAPEYLRRLALLRGGDKAAAAKALKESLRIWDNALVRRALAFASAGRPASALELFVSPPTGAEAALAEQTQFNSLLARARTEADSGQAASAYRTLLMARQVKGYARAPLALSLQARLGDKGARGTLKTGWLKFVGEGSTGCLCAAFVAEERQAVSGHQDGTIRLWELETGRSLGIMKGGGGPIRAVCVVPQRAALLSGAEDGAVAVWDLASGKRVRSLEGHTGAVTAVCRLPDGKGALSAGKDGTLAVWDLDNGSLRCSIAAHKGSVRSVRLAADGVRAASIGQEGLLKQWDIRKGRALGEAIAVGAANGLALSPDGRWALIAGDGGLAEWDLAARARVRAASHKGPGGRLKTVDLSSDGRFLVTGGGDGIARLWDRVSQQASFQSVWSFETHAEAIDFILLSPEGRWTIAGGPDGLRLWELDWEYVFPEGPKPKRS